MKQLKTLIILFISFTFIFQCKSSKKGFPWWLFLLGGGTDGGNVALDGGNGSGNEGPTFTPAIGELDTTFGVDSGNGNNNDAREENKYLSQKFFGATIEKMEMAIQSDGKILIVGLACIDKNNNNICDVSSEVVVNVVRFNADGSIDTTFGNNGVKNIDVAQSAFGVNNKQSRGHSITLDKDNNIFVTGYVVNGADQHHVFVLKLDSNGNLVTSFGSNGNGIKTYQIGSSNINYATKIRFYNNNLYIGGYFLNGAASNDVFLTKMDSGGTIDTNFGSSGHFIFNSGNKNDQSYSFIISENKIYISHLRIDDVHNIANSICVVDPTTGSLLGNSSLIWTTGFRGRDIIRDSEGNFYIGGYKCKDAGEDGTCDGSVPYYYSFAIMKFNSDLTTSSSAEFDLSTTSYGYSLALQPDGKILLGGYKYETSSGVPEDFAIIRVDNNLNLDTSFNSTGKFIWGRSTLRDACYAIEILPTGKILMGGFSSNSDNSLNYTIIRVQ